MRPKNKTKPEDFRSKNLWKLFTLLNNLEKYYLFTGWDESSASGEALYYIEDIFIGGEEPLYAHDSVGDYPYGKMEWLRLELLNIEAGHLNRFSRTFETDAWNEQEKSIEEILDQYKIRIPSDEELEKHRFTEYISEKDGMNISLPESKCGKVSFNASGRLSKYDMFSKRRSRLDRDEAEEISNCLESNYKMCQIGYLVSRGKDKTHDFLVLSDSVSGLRIGGKVVFRESYTFVSLFYDSLPENAEMIDRNDVLEKLNDMNTKDTFCIEKRYPKDNRITNLTTVCFYLDDQNRVCVSTKIDFCQWNYMKSRYADYIVVYLKRLLETLYSLFYTSVTRGVMSEGG